ncbi:MAG: AI-2E family transporter [Chloroflexota bacterium]|nr:MAG: hypothetical protein DLM70_03640 [Chloroflexota bacterium]
MRQLNWTRTLTILLVILAAYALLYVTFSILFRFKQAILLFVVGAMLAYILTPVVNRLEAALRYRWLGIVLSYSALATSLFALGFMLFTPFIDQSKSLVDNLQNPTASSLKTITRVDRDAAKLEHALQLQLSTVHIVGSLTPTDVSGIRGQIGQIQRDIIDLKKGTVSGASHTPRFPSKGPAHGVPPYPQPQTSVPPSYATALSKPLDALIRVYSQATKDPNTVDAGFLTRAHTDAKNIRAAGKRIYHTMATTPILFLRSQAWLDQHGLSVDVSARLGQAVQRFSNQGTLVLDNAITILSDTANALLSLILTLIIAFYLLLDGRRIVHRSIELIPSGYRQQGTFFLDSVDRVLGGYIRGQLFLSVLAGVLGGGGAALLGVPYPLLIGIVTAILEAVPVIGPMVALFPAVLISLFFTPIVTTLILLVWYIVFQQIVTNILGPRVMGMAVGIHPLEALLAVLVGYPIGSFLGAFLAVPVAGILHILVVQAYHYFTPVASRPHPVALAPEESESVPSGSVPVRRRTKADVAR